MVPLPRILLCRCDHAGVIPRQAVAEVSEALHQAQAAFLEVSDLCGLAARKDPLLAQLAEARGGFQVVACYPRAVKWLFAAAGAEFEAGKVALHDLRNDPAAGICAAVLRHSELSRGGDEAACSVKVDSASPAKQGWRPWFPVIDFDLCTQCMQCLSFCLFGVFGVGANRRIAVSQPENCKDNCPACSRVCPEAAIMFPKFGNAPINGGDPHPEELGRAAMKADISALLGGDVYAALRNRTRPDQPRFSPERDPQTAMRERQRFLALLVEAGEIPASVLSSLPPVSELRQRAAAAKQQADLARAEEGQEGTWQPKTKP